MNCLLSNISRFWSPLLLVLFAVSACAPKKNQRDLIFELDAEKSSKATAKAISEKYLGHKFYSEMETQLRDVFRRRAFTYNLRELHTLLVKAPFRRDQVSNREFSLIMSLPEEWVEVIHPDDPEQLIVKITNPGALDWVQDIVSGRRGVKDSNDVMRLASVFVELHYQEKTN